MSRKRGQRVTNCLINFATLFYFVRSEVFSNSEPFFGSCPNFDTFYYTIYEQCPVLEDLRCVPYLPIDLDLTLLTCSTSKNRRINNLYAPLVPINLNNSLHLVGADQFLKLTKHRDQYGRPWCMLTMFYSPYCVFSESLADFVEKVPHVFPQLKVVAVDVSANSRGVET